LKYQRFAPSGGKNIGIRKSEFVRKDLEKIKFDLRKKYF